MKDVRKDAPKDITVQSLGWRLPIALILFVIAIACPIVGTAILTGDFAGKVKALFPQVAPALHSDSSETETGQE